MNILERFAASGVALEETVQTVQHYIEWQSLRNQGQDFKPSSDDDVDLRTYLFHLRTFSKDANAIKEHIDDLQCFYNWLCSQKIITRNPFTEYDFAQPFLTVAQIEHAQQPIFTESNGRELKRLQALGEITSTLNKSVDIHSAIDSTLKTLLKVMNLQTGWVSMRTDSALGRSVFPPGTSTPHGFALVSAHGLPPGLETDDRRYLRQPPACHCQQLLMKGRLTHPVNIMECSRLRDSRLASENTKGLQYHASVPLISAGNPVGILHAASTDWRMFTKEDLQFLSAVSEQLVAGLERANAYEIAEARRVTLENELMVARNVQASLMPKEMPEVPGFDLAGFWHPARQVAGDFYDVFPIDRDHWGIVIGDVAGEGTAGALYMAMAHSLIVSGSLRHRNPATVLTEVNRTLLMQSSSGIFVTVFLGIFNPEKKTIQYANAGHNPPILRQASGEIEVLNRTGVVLGVIEESQFEEKSITLQPGDSLVLYTDGVTEATHPSNGEYGVGRLTNAILEASGNAGVILNHIEEDLSTFVEADPLQDDSTLLVITNRVN